MRKSGGWSGWGLAATLLWLWPVVLLAQTNSASRPTPPTIVTSREPRMVVPQPSFQAGGLHRFLFGNTWRSLWTDPVPVRVIDLSRTGGGLTAVPRGEGHNSRPFEFAAPDGRTFGFRELVKDATLDWPEEHRTASLSKLAREQVSGTVPGGALAIAVIERAAGVAGLPVQLVLLPDDARLGQWKQAYSGKAGTIEPRLRHSDEWLDHVRSEELVSSSELFDTLRSDPASEVDARQFLAARLVDILVGDWDRHEGQWTWAAVSRGGTRYWQPIGSDRDWAFNHLDGLFWSVVRKALPKFQRFDGRIAGLNGLLHMSQPVDRRLFASLDRKAWDSTTTALVRRVNDSVIARAVSALPPRLDPDGLALLERTLRERRDHLPEVASRFYLKLAEVVEVWTTEAADRVELADAGSGALKLTVNRGAGRGARWSRTFVPGETREVRIYLHGGADRVSGNWKGGPIRVRVIHAGNGALAVDPGLAGVAVYDSTDSWKPPRKPFDPGEMMRDWGGSTGIAPWLNQRSGMGLVLGGGPVITRFGFRRYPYAWRVAARAAYVTGTRAVNLDLKSDFRLARPGTGIRFDAGALWGEAVYFFGFGNQTERVEESDFYRLHQKRFQVNPRLYLELGKRGRIAAGPVVHHSVSDESKPSLARIERPYGFGSFTAVGGSIGGSLDLRDDPVYPVRGIRAEAEGRWFPAVGDVAEQFGVIRGELSGYLGTRSLPATPVVAVRVGGAHGMGPLPFFEAPAIGGTRTVRGFTRDRFTGQSALYGNAELRLRFGWFKLVLPGEWGVFGMGDIGRVYLEGESSSLWHKTWGGGLWVSFFERKPAFSLAWARGSDGGKFYLSGGLHF